MRERSTIDAQALLRKAVRILDENWNGNFTLPSPVLYPHQWSWDSAFIAIGSSHVNTERAIKELEFLFDSQWKNGMLPHIVFSEGKDTYFPDGTFYNIPVSENAPRNVRTSGLTHPPVHAIACYYVYKNASEDSRGRARKFLERIYPKLVKYHDYLLTVRDPEKSGLVTIFHPWESGFDNLPIWDEPLSRIKVEDWKKIRKYHRVDVVAVGNAREIREDDATYYRFLYLVALMKEKYNYDAQKMYMDFPFKVKDVAFSSILLLANKYLLKIAQLLGQDTRQIEQWRSRAERNFFRYFAPTQSLSSLEADDLYDYDLVKRDWIRKRTVASIVPICTDVIPREKIEVLARWINHAHYCGAGNCHVPALPSTDLAEAYFKPNNYWRGPVWINVNWMIYYGLMHYDYRQRAEQIRQGLFELAQNHGFSEYYDPLTGKGLGAKNFSWTAALIIDLIKAKEATTKVA